MSRVEDGELENRVTSGECLNCCEITREYQIDGCEHFLCKSCLQEYLQLVMNEPSYYPPKCCGGEIRIHGQKLEYNVSEILGEIFGEEYIAKTGGRREENQTYCANCNVRVHPDVHPYTKCDGCGTYTCSWCKEKVEAGHRCPHDQTDLQLGEYASMNDIQRCYQCGRWIELLDGCKHMTCICGGEFCMGCGQALEICDCTISDLPMDYETSDREDGSNEERGANEGEDDIDDAEEHINDEEQNVQEEGQDTSVEEDYVSNREGLMTREQKDVNDGDMNGVGELLG